MIKERYWEIFKREDDEIVASWKGDTSSQVIAAVAKTLGVKDKKLALRKYSARPLREDLTMNMVQLKETISKSNSVRAKKIKNGETIKEVRVKWASIITLSVEKRAKVDGEDTSSIELGLESGNYFQCWLRTSDVPKFVKKWEEEIASKE